MLTRFSLLLVLCLSVLSCENFNFSATHEGKVIKVLDGDTLKISQQGKTLTIRLAEIDAPEYQQPFWEKSKQALEKHVLGRHIIIEEFDRDQYGRIVGHVYLNDIWINGNLVKHGYAYVYDRYAISKKLYAFEAEAEKFRRGVWKLSDSERIKPWLWRKNKK